MVLALLKGFNNYINRVNKKYDTFQEYQNNCTSYHLTSNLNFNPRDGVVTTQLVTGEEFEGCDYLLVLDPLEHVIVSRWFIIDSEKVRANQFQLALKRDSVADKLEAILSSTSYIYKGYSQLPNYTSVKEGFNFNQVKQSETLLKDSSGNAWLVAYLSKNLGNDSTYQIGTSTYKGKALEFSTALEYNYDSLSQWSQQFGFNISSPLQRNIYNSWNMFYSFGVYFAGAGGGEVEYRPFDNEFKFYNGPNRAPGAYTNITCSQVSSNPAENLPNVRQGQSIQDLATALANEFEPNLTTIPYKLYDNLVNENGKTVKVGDDIYSINISLRKESGTDWTYATGTIEQKMLSLLQTDSKYSNSTGFGSHGLRLYQFDQEYIVLSFTKVNTSGLSSSSNNYIAPIHATNVNEYTVTSGEDSGVYKTHCYGITYDILAMPYANTTINGISFTKEQALAYMTGIASTDACYDLQLIPYKPLIDERTTHLQQIYLKGATNPSAYGYWVKDNTINITLDYSIEIINAHRQANTDLWRICSPDGSAVYEFNAVDNNGVDVFYAQCSLAPYTPFIHVYPRFKNLYGSNFNDYRGLIGGNYSLPTLKDAWQNYVLNNKNYKESFDRSIKSQELSFGWNLAGNITGAVGSAVSSTVSGAMVGGVAGAVGGAVLGSAEGALNIVENVILGRDRIDAQKDQFKYQLGNIQAMPYTLSNSSVLVNSNKLFPYLEHYSCTDAEKQIFDDSIKYEGMTINTIGKISDFILGANSYIRAKLIRIEGLEDDYHLANDINTELMKGVYFNV